MRHVRRIQEQHEQIIRELLKRCGLREVYVEGLSTDEPALNDFLEAIRGGDAQLKRAAQTNARLNAFLWKLDRIRPLNQGSTSFFKLRFGAPAALFLSGELPNIMPIENRAARLNATLGGTDGRLHFNAQAMELREDAMAAALLKGSMPSLVILGRGHDLTDNLRRASGDSVDYVRIQSDECWIGHTQSTVRKCERR